MGQCLGGTRCPGQGDRLDQTALLINYSFRDQSCPPGGTFQEGPHLALSALHRCPGPSCALLRPAGRRASLGWGYPFAGWRTVPCTFGNVIKTATCPQGNSVPLTCPQLGLPVQGSPSHDCHPCTSPSRDSVSPFLLAPNLISDYSQCGFPRFRPRQGFPGMEWGGGVPGKEAQEGTDPPSPRGQ